MKKSILLLTSAVLLSSFQLIQAEDSTPMGDGMSAVSKALKKFRKLEKTDWPALAATAKEAHEAFLISMDYTAAVVTQMEDGPEKDIALADSRRLMGLCYAALCELELAYLAKDQAKVDEVTSKYKALKKEGHKLYTED